MARELSKRIAIARIINKRFAKKDRRLPVGLLPVFNCLVLGLIGRPIAGRPHLSVTGIKDRGFKERHTAETPKNPSQTLHKLALQGGLRIMLIYELRPKLVKVISVFTDNDEHLCREAVLA